MSFLVAIIIKGIVAGMKQGFSKSGEPLSRQCEEIRGDPSQGLYRHHCEQLPDTKYKE